MFRRLVREHDPDLAVLFTNHVASAMHRYWYATFPDDWNETIYDAAWIARYRGEIEYAMTLLDRSIAGLLDVCETTGRVLMVCTAIGQRADTDVTDAVREFAVVRDPEQFVAALRVPGRFEIKPGMVPQIGLAFVDEASAEVAETYLATVPRAGLSLLVDRQGNVVTVSYDFPSGQRSIEIEGRVLQLREVGVAIEAVDDQRCAEHDPVGSLLVHGVVPATTTTRIDVRAFAPALLEVLGVEPPVWHEHRELGFDRRPATTTR
jgi:hypothetical protein